MDKNHNKQSDELDKTEERILQYLSQWGDREVNIGEIQAYLSEISDETFDFYIEELRKRDYLKKSRKGELVWLSNLGRKYLTKNKSIEDKNTCKAKKKKNEFCKNHPLKNSIYCYRHSFGKFRGIPWHKNSTVHFFASIILAIILFLTGPSRSNQEKMLKNDKKTHTKLDSIDDKLSETIDRKNGTSSKKSSTAKYLEKKTLIDNKQLDEITKLVSTLEKLLLEDTAEIKSPDYIEDKTTGELRKVDISIHKMIGSVPVFIIIDCKDNSILDDTLWIEQIAQKRDAIKASKAVAVFNGYLSDNAMQKATHLNVETRLVSEITLNDVSDWLQAQYMTQWIYHVDFLRVSFMTEKEKQEQLNEFIKNNFSNKKFDTNEDIFLNTEDNRKYSFDHIWHGMFSKKIKEIYTDVDPKGEKIRRTLVPSFSNPKSRYQILIDNDSIDILEIKMICDLWIEEKLIPFALKQYSSQENQLVDSVGVKIEANGIEYNLNMHKNIKTGEMYISGNNLSDIRFDFKEVKKDKMSE